MQTLDHLVIPFPLPYSAVWVEPSLGGPKSGREAQEGVLPRQAGRQAGSSAYSCRKVESAENSLCYSSTQWPLALEAQQSRQGDTSLGFTLLLLLLNHVSRVRLCATP